jgi:formylglycine-generating enzyme required for sulfatase activity
MFDVKTIMRYLTWLFQLHRFEWDARILFCAKCKWLECAIAFSLLKTVGNDFLMGEVLTVEMVGIPKGYFTMAGVGSVYVSDFKIDKYEVTAELWNQVRDWALKNGYDISSGDSFGPNHPVHSIHWFDAVKWCNARSEMSEIPPAFYLDANKSAVYRTGLQVPAGIFWTEGYRLPTEAEWEKAARGGSSNKLYPFLSHHDGKGNKRV